MKKEIYTALRDAILTSPDITDVRLWNSSIMDEPDAIGRLPLVFVEFTGIAYNQGTNKMQEVERPGFKLHLIYKTLDHGDTLIFDISQNLYKALDAEGYRRTQEAPVYGPGETLDWQITIEGPRFVDGDAIEDMITIAWPPLLIE